ncbi:MAG: hypothetical protein KF866_12330 [Phycisphaeraceae bacterium]|nr:hypothetical protein [Phycisphaeraceae bacterium]MCW5755321.1 hypothetical protein [Phycisphaeraceae bacterium]
MRWIWIDRVVEVLPGAHIVAVKHVSLSEEHLLDHFGRDETGCAMPVMPASLIIEGVAQTAGILLGVADGFREKIVLAKISRAELTRDAMPGATLRYTAKATHQGAQGAAISAIIEVRDASDPSGPFETAGFVDLMFSFLDKNMSGLDFPADNFVFGETFQTLLRASGVSPTMSRGERADSASGR